MAKAVRASGPISSTGRSTVSIISPPMSRSRRKPTIRIISRCWKMLRVAPSATRASCESILTHRVIEVGGIMYTPELQRTIGATEAQYLFARHVFDDLGYRRYEWKCNDLNAPSKSAAERLGFTFEGVFRQHMIVKGRNRDTAWFSMLDFEWPAVKRGFERWLDPANFDAAGRQKASLSALRSGGA